METQPAPAARHYRWLALGFAAFVVYGSLVPFHFRHVPFGTAVAQYRQVCASPVRVESRSDWVANVLLYIPLGVFAMGALSADRRRSAGFLAAMLVVPGCAALSATMEFAQLYFPPRVSSVNDIVADSLGALVGASLWLAVGQTATAWLRGVWGGLGLYGASGRLLPAYLVFLVLTHVLPLDLTLSPAELYHKYRDGRIVLVPFTHGRGPLFERMRKDVLNAAYFLPVGWLLAAAGVQWPRKPLGVLAIGLALAGGVEVLQLFVLSRFSDTTDVLTGGAAVLAGWGLGVAYRRRVGEPAAGEAVPAGDIIGGDQGGGRFGTGPVLGSIAWLAVLVVANWAPFDFNPSPAAAISRLRTVCWVPFEDYYQGNFLNGIDQVVDKTVLFVPAGVLLALAWRAFGSTRVGLRVVLTAAVLAAVLEAGQLFLPSRYASVTDVLVEASGAWIGWALVRQAWEHASNVKGC